MSLWVRLTFVWMYPHMRLRIRLTFGETYGQVDIWSVDWLAGQLQLAG